MGTNIIIVDDNCESTSSVMCTNSLTELSNLVESNTAKLADIENGTFIVPEADNAQHAVNADNAQHAVSADYATTAGSAAMADDSAKLAGMLPGTGANSVLHTNASGNLGIATAPMNERVDEKSIELPGLSIVSSEVNNTNYRATNAYRVEGGFRFKKDGYATLESIVDDDVSYYYAQGTAGADIVWTPMFSFNSTGVSFTCAGSDSISPVVESGSNANGTYTKFVDGTMICSHRETYDIPINIAAGALWRSSEIILTFPAEFSFPPVFSPFAGRGGADQYRYFATLTHLLSHEGGITVTSTTSNSSISAMRGYIATGRWYNED